jgi:hypothetical protein
MDHVRDFSAFKHLLARLCEVFSKPMTDELLESYWGALRNSSLVQVTSIAERYIASATDKSRMPRPAQLRPDDDPLPGETGPNWARGFWRSQIVDALFDELAITRRVCAPAEVEGYIARHGDAFGSLRPLLDELEDLEAKNKGQRTPGMFQLVTQRCSAVCKAYLDYPT